MTGGVSPLGVSVGDCIPHGKTVCSPPEEAGDISRELYCHIAVLSVSTKASALSGTNSVKGNKHLSSVFHLHKVVKL